MALFKKTHESRASRRARDLELWSRPLNTPWRRFRAWASMTFADHGIFRAIYPNYFWLSPRAARAAQPSPGLLRRFAREGGRSVLSLRGGMLFGSLPLETATCAELGLEFHKIRVRSRDLPTREEFADLAGMLRAVPKPVLYHCKSGADRAGFVSVLHMHLIEGQPLPEALDQLSWRYGHFRHARTGILDAFYDCYLAETEGGTTLSLEDWVATVYDPERVRASFHVDRSESWIVDRLLKRE